MKVCMTGHVYPLPPTKYAGVERVASWWINELRARGHEVELVANSDSRIAVDWLHPKRVGDRDDFVMGIREARKRGCQVVHDNNDCHTPDPDRFDGPYIYTVHACVWNDNPCPVFLSNNQARWFKYTERTGREPVVNHNGLPADEYPYEANKEDFILWCASIRACKAPEMAVQLAKDTGVNLKIIGPMQDGNYGYLRGLKGNIQYLGEMGPERLKYFRSASAFLYTCGPEWMEGFNLTNIEALLSGTPVIGLKTPNNSIVDEQIDDGVNGFICESYDDLKRTIGERLWSRLNPSDCRKKGEFHDVRNTVTRYEKIYERVIAGERW